jgi:hypothetical protein
MGLVEWLKAKVLSSSPSTTKKKKKQKLRFKERNDLLKVTVIEPAFEPYCLSKKSSLFMFSSFCLRNERSQDTGEKINNIGCIIS